MTSSITAVGKAPAPPAITESISKGRDLSEGIPRQPDQQSQQSNPALVTNNPVTTQTPIAAYKNQQATTTKDNDDKGVVDGKEIKEGKDTNPLSDKELRNMVDKLNQEMKRLRKTGLQFNIDDKAEELVVKVVDVEKDEVIRQIPREDVLALTTFLNEQDEKAAKRNEWAAFIERGVPKKLTTATATSIDGWLLNAKV